MDNVHVVKTAAPVDTAIGDEMVIFRSARGTRGRVGGRGHINVREGWTIRFSGNSTAQGVAVANARVLLFRNIPDTDIVDGYYAGARTRPALFKWLKRMYNGNYLDNTPTIVIRVRREK